jgi:hypothetical protein
MNVFMKPLLILLNIILAVFGFYGGIWIYGRKIYEQIHFQFTDPRADDPTLGSMWPMTMEMLLVLVSFLTCVVSLSYVINRNLGRLARVIAGILALLLIGGWIGCATFMAESRASNWKRGGYAGSPSFSVLDQMLTFDGQGFLMVAIVSFCVAALAGRGPVKLAADGIRRRFAKR